MWLVEGRVAGKITSSNSDGIVLVMLRLKRRPGSTLPMEVAENGSFQLGVVLRKSKEACEVEISGVGGTDTFGAKGRCFFVGG
jgi:hypothetical protein